MDLVPCVQVMVNPGLDEIKRSTFQYDFDYEHKIAAEYGLDDSHDREHPGAQSSSASHKDLPSLLQVSTAIVWRCRQNLIPSQSASWNKSVFCV